MLKGINHITVAVSNIEHSFGFYTELLGMKAHAKWEFGAYLSLGSLWFCLSVDEVKPNADYTHIAFDIAECDFPRFVKQLRAAKVKEWKVNKSEGQSLYILDPDGHKLEIHCGSLSSRLASMNADSYKGLVRY